MENDWNEHADLVFPGIWFRFLDDVRLIGTEGSICAEEIVTLHYCHTGRARIKQKGGELELTGGDLFLVPGRHGGHAQLLSNRYSGLSLILAPADAGQAVRAFLEDVLVADVDWDGMIRALRAQRGSVLQNARALRQVFSQLFLADPPQGKAFFRLKAMELLLLLSARCSEGEGRGRHYLERGQVERIREIRAYLTRHIELRLTQTQIARQFRISLTALKQGFRDVYGMSLDRCLREERVRAAKELLRETALPVSEIAHRVGYESHSQFTAVFRAAEGLPPGEFRRRQRQNE